MLRRWTMTGIAEYWGRSLAQQLGLEPAAGEVLSFGFKLVLGFLLSVGVLAAISWPLGILPHAAAVSLTGGTLRLVSGGAHSATPAGCAIVGGIITSALGLLARLGGRLLAPDLAWGLTCMGIPWTFACCLRYAPAAAPNKPLRPAQARRLTFASLGMVVVWSAAFLAFGHSHVELWLASALGISWQGFSITPLGHRLADSIDNLQ